MSYLHISAGDIYIESSCLLIDTRYMECEFSFCSPAELVQHFTPHLKFSICSSSGKYRHVYDSLSYADSPKETVFLEIIQINKDPNVN